MKIFSRKLVPAKISSLKVLGKISQSSDAKIGLQIRKTCSKTLQRDRIIQSRNEEPYAFRTVLNWCVVSPLQKDADAEPILFCQTVVTETGWKKISNHHFVIDKSIGQTGVQQMSQKMYPHEFT